MDRVLPLVLAVAISSGSSVAQAPSAASPNAVALPRQSPTVAELVAARQAGMHMAATLLYQGVLPRAKGNGDLKDVHFSEGIELWAAAIPGLFPEGSSHPQSRARIEIWADKRAFDRRAAALAAAAAKVTAAGKKEDQPAYAAAAEELRRTCSACHDAYRSEPAGPS
jgi:hypothetical protein